MSHRYELKSENKGATDQALDFPRLSLKKGEVARLAVFSLQEVDGRKQLSLPAPEGGYYWSIRKADDSFGGSFECLASEEAKAADEFEPDACAHCKARVEGAPESIIEPRKRRFVMPVIRYRTAPGKSTLIKPYGVECVAWTFTDRYFNTLVDEHEKWADDGGLLGHDISLLCEVEGYQTFKISVEPQAAWKQDKELANLVFGTYAAGVELAPTLRRKLGATLSNDQMEAKITEALRVAGMVESGAVQATAADLESISGLADELFGETPAIPDAGAAQVAAPAPDEVVAVDVPAEAVAPAEAAPEAGDEAEAETLDFDSFFSS